MKQNHKEAMEKIIKESLGITGKEEFKVKFDGNGLAKINYNYITSDTFKRHGVIDENLLEYRGLVISLIGDVIARPLHKFFNIDENEYTNRKHFKDNIQFMEKLDGSLIYVYHYNDKQYINTQGTFEENSQTKLAKEVIDNSKEYQKLIDDYKDYTVIFELISPSNQIVVQYKETKLVLIGIRDKDGNYISLDDCKSNYNVVYPKTYNFDNLDNAFDFIKESEGMEGLVMKRDRLWAKLKTPWYLKRHRVFTAVSLAVHRIVELSLNGEIDDILGDIEIMPDHKKIITEIWEDTMDLKQQIKAEINAEHTFSAHMTDKEVGLSTFEHKGALFNIRKGRDPDEYINRRVLQYFKEKFCNIKVIDYHNEKF